MHSVIEELNSIFENLSKRIEYYDRIQSRTNRTQSLHYSNAFGTGDDEYGFYHRFVTSRLNPTPKVKTGIEVLGTRLNSVYSDAVNIRDLKESLRQNRIRPKREWNKRDIVRQLIKL